MKMGTLKTAHQSEQYLYPHLLIDQLRSQFQAFWGRSENAVKTQIWFAVATYALVAIIRKKLELSKSMHEILQILSISLFDKMSVKQFLSEYENRLENNTSKKQLTLQDF